LTALSGYEVHIEDFAVAESSADTLKGVLDSKQKLQILKIIRGVRGALK